MKKVRHFVCKKEDLKPGQMKVVYISKKKPVLVTCNNNHEYHAIFDICPHQGARLSKGKLTWKTVSNDPCKYDIANDGEIVRCPWHSFDYDVKTGQSIVDTKMKIKQFKVVLEDGNVMVEE